MYNNYKVIKTQNLADINSLGTLLVHEKSQAKVLLIQNDDENKMFCIGFRTPPYDDTGLPHILEHSVLCGSRKFPVKEPFVELMKSSLNTFLNAMTYPDKTCYPVASCNDKDFANLMDVYMDAVLYPNIHTNEKIFRQEGWHYELENVDGEITYNGVVYNEMKGAFSSPDEILGRESLNGLFPDTEYGVESGGNPDFIPTLSYEDFKNFHKKYYHPSNSYIILYGNADMEERLAWLDKEYLSAFDAIKIDSELHVQKPFDKMIEKEIEYPVSAQQGLENKTYISYNVAMPAGVSVVESWGLNIVTQVLLEAAGAPLKEALLNEKIGEVINGNYESSILQPVLGISADNANVSDKDRFVVTIEKNLKEIIEKKIDRKALQAAINRAEFKLREADYGGMSKGLIYALSCLDTWLYNDNDPFSTLELTKIFDELKANLETSFYEDLIQKYILDNTHKTLVVVKPSLEIQAKKEAELKAKLAAYKNSLTKEQVEEIVKQTIELKEYQASPDTKENLETIPLLKKEDLSYDVIPLSNIVSSVEGVKVLHHDIATNGIGYVRLLFNALNIEDKYLPYLGIFRTMLGSLDTKNHTYQTLEQDINTNTGGVDISMFTTNSGDNYTVNLSIRASVLYDKINYALDIVDEIIHTTNFDMKTRIKECIAREISYMQQKLVGRGHVQAYTRAMSYIEPTYYINDVVDGIAYFDTLTDLMKNYDESYDNLINILNELAKSIFTKENLLASFTGSIEGLETFKNGLPKFINNLNEPVKVVKPFEFIPNQLNEGFKAPYDVQYVALCGNFKKAGLPYTGALQVFQNAVSTDYLWKNVRVLGGAYGCSCGFRGTGEAFFVSYRDPNLTKTLDVYHEVVKYIEEFEATPDEMIKYIIGAVGNFDFPLSPANKGVRSLGAYLNGKTVDDYKLEKQQIIDATVEDIKKVLPYIQAVIEQNNICVIGNEAKVEEAKNIFKETKMLLK